MGKTDKNFKHHFILLMKCFLIVFKNFYVKNILLNVNKINNLSEIWLTDKYLHRMKWSTYFCLFLKVNIWKIGYNCLISNTVSKAHYGMWKIYHCVNWCLEIFIFKQLLLEQLFSPDFDELCCNIIQQTELAYLGENEIDDGKLHENWKMSPSSLKSQFTLFSYAILVSVQTL